MSHANISIFVAHLGCPHLCSFCDQFNISGSASIPNSKSIEEAVILAESTKNFCAAETELAFFGGSFTAIDKEYMLELLEAAYQFVKQGRIKGIRISTRPDCIDEAVLNILKAYGVTAIELGAQSMCDDVLLANNRGHNAECVVQSSKMIKDFCFELGLQMMTGLYKSTQKMDIFTAQEIIKLKPDTVRIYPTITLKGTMLEKLYLSGSYVPPTLDQTVDLCVELLTMFKNENINVIRTGLHSIDTKRYVAGPWHPSFKELCDSRIYLNKLISCLSDKGEYNVFVNPKEISKVLGNKKSNIEKLNKLGYKCHIKADSKVEPLSVILERVNNSCS